MQKWSIYTAYKMTGLKSCDEPFKVKFLPLRGTSQSQHAIQYLLPVLKIVINSAFSL